MYLNYEGEIGSKRENNYNMRGQIKEVTQNR
jgi:hypothetical protein